MTKQEWQSIETAPMAEWVLAWGPSSIVRSAAKCQSNGKTWWTDGCVIKTKLTHWMPLPAPPISNGEEPNG